MLKLTDKAFMFDHYKILENDWKKDLKKSSFQKKRKYLIEKVGRNLWQNFNVRQLN